MSHVQPAISFAAEHYLSETKLTVRRALFDAMTVYCNEDSVMRDKAIEAILEGRSAYWTTSTYSSAATSDLPYALNAGVDIDVAVDEAYPDRRFAADPDLQKRLRIAALDTIVPLNFKAAFALSITYSGRGIWRDEEELLMRSKRDMRPPAKREPLTYANYKAGKL